MRHRSLLALAVSLAAIAACTSTAEAATPPDPVATVRADSVREAVTVSPIVTLTQDRIMAENTSTTSETRKFDETQPGGRYIGADGIARNADGEVLTEQADSAKDAPADSSGASNGSNAASAADSGATNTSSSASPAPTKSKSELEAMDKADLQALADKEQLTVTGTGANGNVLKSDLVDVLATKYGATS